MDVGAVGAIAVRTLAGATAAGVLVRVAMQVEQSRHARVDDEDDVATVAAVTPVGTAERLDLPASYRGAAAPAATGGGVQHGPVDEGRGHARRGEVRGAAASGGRRLDR